MDDRFLQMFFEEARELLISLEEGLMELERRQGERAHLDKTFRAAHSIKGAAAMVGLGGLADFTHNVEAVLDKVRNGTLAVDSDLISTLLEARDHLASAVEAEAAGAPISPPTDLVNRLLGFVRDSPTGSKPPVAVSPSPPPIPVSPPPTADPAATRKPVAPEPPPSPAKNIAAETPAGKPPRKPRKPREPKVEKPKSEKKSKVPVADSKITTVPDGKNHYRIRFIPGPELLRRGVNPLGVLDELRELGEAVVVTDPEDVPPLDELDPERCFLSWTIELTTDTEPDRLDDVFLFLAEDSTVTIERRTSDGRVVPPTQSLDAFPLEVPTAVSSIPALPVAPAPKAKVEAPTALTTTVPEAIAPPPVPKVAPVPTPVPPATQTAPAAPSTGTPRPAASVPSFAAAKPSARIRVDAGQLDDLVGLAGELAVLSDNLQTIRDTIGIERWVTTLEALERVSRQIRDTTLELRMVPVEELFSRFPRVVRDLADRSGKEIELRIQGQETRLDRTIVERLSEPMIHLIRNCVDHGLETPAERLASGKSRSGRITLTAGHEGDRVALRIEDDGRGLDRQKIVKRGIAAGLVPVGTSPDDPRVDTLIFEAGFTTRDEVSELSGRGVGLDVVRDAVRSLRGSLAVESSPGKGTIFIFRLPLTLALIDGLLVETAGHRYVVPLAQVEECVALSGMGPALARERPCVSVRGELVPMVPLRKLFHAEGPPPQRQELLLTRHAGQRVGVAVDRLLGRVQAVIQTLGEGLSGLRRFSGATILGDGTVSLILDLAALVAESRAADAHLAMSPRVMAQPVGGR